MLRVAMVSKWHVHAEGYAKQFNGFEDACVSCVWDDDRARGEAWAKQMNVPFEADYDALLKREDVDAVAICSPTNMHAELMIKAANAKKHIFTEKVMCLTVADCERVKKAVEDNGVIFTISFPHRCFPENIFIKNAIESGMLGEITLFRVRNCHNGSLANWLPEYWYDPATTGGGAMMDLGAHPMYLSRWFLGKPVSIQSAFSNHTNRTVEDDAISMIRFENGALAVAETSLVSPYTPRICEVYGTKGVILSENGKLRVRVSTIENSDNNGWITPKLPAPAKEPIRQFVDSVLYGKKVEFGVNEGIELTELMENAYIADGKHAQIEF
ncbi:MAG: Gfo/Idh/MocA family oxidoreductase [Clostridia bacterium]|nr:Gfo/Idh/MocA family oxidoreductase [Clostridia bacterium]MBQ4157660.1 Gfo/Idh/MocA family oxidoreductase [Clostridia bacterium]